MSESHLVSLEDVREVFGVESYPNSFVQHRDAALWLMRTWHGKRLAIVTRNDHPLRAKFDGESQPFKDDYRLHLCPTTHTNARVLRDVLTALRPVPLGLSTSAGFGDRLGLATAGHVRALNATSGKSIAPIFAQQSIREMTRSNRTPEDVMSDATWGAFEAGWRAAVGADADHLKTPADIDVCAAAGFTFFTFDPGEYVDSAADKASSVDIQNKLAVLPWNTLNSSLEDLRQRYVGQAIDLAGCKIELTAEVVLRAAVKYGRAVAHVAMMYRHLESKGVPFEVEVSVDETETPTTHAEHFYIANELKRLRVQWISLAPRYVGRFEKGVDYIGDLDQLRDDLAVHAAIARALGPYKLSLHSGSDKFSVYPLIVEAAQGRVHLKTAGTSYLEALRAIARVAPELFRSIVALAIDRYPTDRATYHVSAELERVPALSTLVDKALPGMLDQFDARQILHVTFGSALAQFGVEIKSTLLTYEEQHYTTLEQHFIKHVQPFVH